MQTTATVKGQIVIPAVFRQKLGIEAGTRLDVELDEPRNRLILRPITREYVHSLRGKFRGKGLMEALQAEKAKEREL